MSSPRWVDRRRRLASVVVGAIVLAACGGGDGNRAACSAVERVLESSGTHVLPGVEVTFEYSPPTSGPHQVPAPGPGVSEDPIAEPLQVAALEQGWVLLQYSPEAPAADIAALEALASTDGVIIAPGARPFDDDATFAFTAWSRRQLCSALDLAAARAFIVGYQGVFFTPHG